MPFHDRVCRHQGPRAPHLYHYYRRRSGRVTSTVDVEDTRLRGETLYVSRLSASAPNQTGGLNHIGEGDQSLGDSVSGPARRISVSLVLCVDLWQCASMRNAWRI